MRGKNINGKEVINDSEFKQILKFIEANGMALNLEIYNEVLRAYLAGKIDINKVYSKKVVNTYNESKNRLCKDLLSLLNDAIESDLDVKTELTKIYELKKERKM